jgi:hypothetical protein
MLENLLTHNKTDRKARNLGTADQVECFLDDCRRKNETGRCRRERHGQGSILALKELLLGVAIDVVLGRDYLLLEIISLTPFSIENGRRNRSRLNAEPN